MCKNRKKNICIDFDGVIHDFSKGFCDGTIYGDILPGSKEFIDKIKDDYRVVIFTARFRDYNYKTRSEKINMVENIIDWLSDHNVYYDELTCIKEPAIAYIDDRGIAFQGDWDHVTKELERIKNIR